MLGCRLTQSDSRFTTGLTSSTTADTIGSARAAPTTPSPLNMPSFDVPGPAACVHAPSWIPSAVRSPRYRALQMPCWERDFGLPFELPRRFILVHRDVGVSRVMAVALLRETGDAETRFIRGVIRRAQCECLKDSSRCSAPPICLKQLRKAMARLKRYIERRRTQRYRDYTQTPPPDPISHPSGRNECQRGRREP
jgi:hypothetical protein